MSQESRTINNRRRTIAASIKEAVRLIKEEEAEKTDNEISEDEKEVKE